MVGVSDLLTGLAVCLGIPLAVFSKRSPTDCEWDRRVSSACTRGRAIEMPEEKRRRH